MPQKDQPLPDDEQETNEESQISKLPDDLTDNPETDKAVDEISNHEADRILEVEDRIREGLNVEPNNFKVKLGRFFKAWLGTKQGWYITLAFVFVSASILMVMPKTRYYLLNAYGVRASLSLNVTDGNTDLPLQNVAVAIGYLQGKTNRNGDVTVTNLRLGPQRLTVFRPGFAKVSQSVTIGWGENPLGNFPLKETGQQYIIYAKDLLTGKAVTSAQAVSNGFNALSNSAGKITLTVSGSSGSSIQVEVSAEGYNTQNINISGNSSATVNLVPAGKDIFVSPSIGTNDLYSCNLDGSDTQLLLAATPTQTDNMSIAVSPNDAEVALVSTRDSVYDSSGKLQDSMTLINIGSGSTLTLDHAEQIQIIGWAGETVVYQEQISAGTPTYNLISYNYATNSRDQLATSAQFSSAFIAAGTVYYAVPDSETTTTGGFFSIKPDGSGLQTILSQGVGTVLRTGYSSVNLQTDSSWYGYSIGRSSATQSASAPLNYDNRTYIDSPDNSHSAWVNSTDSSNQLLVYDIASGSDNNITTPSSVSYPIWWISNKEMVYRVVTSTGSSDYLEDISTNSSRKIIDVANINGVQPGP